MAGSKISTGVREAPMTVLLAAFLLVNGITSAAADGKPVNSPPKLRRGLGLLPEVAERLIHKAKKTVREAVDHGKYIFDLVDKVTDGVTSRPIPPPLP